MTMNKIKIVFVYVFLFFMNFVNAQKDTLLPLSYNPALTSQGINTQANERVFTLVGDTLELPFIDDFSEIGPYPNMNKWMPVSNSVFVNRTYGRNPPTLGVATFDGLKSNGYPYKPLVNSGASNADTLTSKFIRLDSITFPPVAITPADSVYFSFNYQPKGFGHTPLNTHTLLLDFYNPTTQSWSTVLTLSRTGNSAKDSTFTRVMIPIKDANYFKKQFQFRFRNKNTACGSVNHWHIDNIYLGKDRGKTDTSSTDLAYVYQAQTLLEKYTSMPFNQYTGATQMANNSYLTIRNNDRFTTNFTGFMGITDNLGSSVLYDTTGSDNALPFATNGYVSNPDIIDFMNSTVSSDISNFSYNNGNPLSDSITYFIKHFMRTSAGDRIKSNDTLVYEQKFHNYFSYDDGTAELAWGLQGTFGAEAAVQFNMANLDTLRAVDIFFNPVSSIMSISTLTFGLRVWNDGGGVPGSYLYDDNNSTTRNPTYLPWGNNVFVRYYLNYPLIMNAGTFYVGMKQDDQQILNVGFDQNTNTQSKLFYNTNGTWANSSFKGSLMIRPVFGDSLWAATGIKDINEKPQSAFIYPNPAANEINIFVNNAKDEIINIEIIDAMGKTILRKDNCSTSSISVTELEAGFYFTRIYSNNKLMSTNKLIISK